MFDALLSNVKRQTTLLTESWNELLADPRHPSDSSDSLSAAARAERMPSSIQKSLVSVLSTAGDSRYGTVPKSQSSSAVSSANNKQEPLKWPVLVNNERKWVSSTLFRTEKTQPSVEYDDNSSESETETVFCNPVTGSDCAADSEEESLVDKFNRVLATGKSSRRRRNDREEIRKRLAMGIECDDVVIDTKKPSLHSRLQSGMNLQICFMNETASDGSDSEKGNGSEIVRDPYLSLPVVSKLNHSAVQQQQTSPKDPEMDFFTQQSKLQVEARKSLAQAKELARVQMQVERQQKKRSLISDLVRQSLEKLGLPFTWDCRRLSRQILTELNVAQLQVIVNDLHTQIEGLNEELVQMLLKRDDFHMEQDSMLVDIEDLTRYLTAKQTMSIPSSADFPQESGPVSLPVQKSNAQSPKQRLRSFRISGLRK